GGEARQILEDEAGVVAEGVCLLGWQVGRASFCRVGGEVQAVQAGCHQPVTALLPLRFRRLQLVAQRHQFVHLGDDAVLLGEGREGNLHFLEVRRTNAPISNGGSTISLDVSTYDARFREASDKLWKHKLRQEPKPD